MEAGDGVCMCMRPREGGGRSLDSDSSSSNLCCTICNLWGGPNALWSKLWTKYRVITFLTWMVRTMFLKLGLGGGASWGQTPGPQGVSRKNWGPSKPKRVREHLTAFCHCQKRPNHSGAGVIVWVGEQFFFLGGGGGTKLWLLPMDFIKHTNLPYPQNDKLCFSSG